MDNVIYSLTLRVHCSVYLVTHSPVESVPAAAAAEVLLVNFAPEREGLEDHLFGQFLAVQNMKTFNDWRDLHEVGVTAMKHNCICMSVCCT